MTTPGSNGSPAPLAWRYWARCKWCSCVHDTTKVTVVSRYTDCSVWRCPGCSVLLDDRPERWGGGTYPVTEAEAREAAKGRSAP